MRPHTPRPRTHLTLAGTLAAAVVLAALAGIGGGPLSSASSLPPAGGSDDMRLVGHVDLPNTTSIAFSPLRPVAYVLTRHAGGELVSLDVTDPRNPRVISRLPIGPQVYLEDLDLGVRRDGTTFVLTRASGDYRQSTLQVVDVTDPRAMRLRGTTAVGAHTWTCINTGCTHAYGSAGDEIPVVDVTDLDDPGVVQTFRSPVGRTHDFNVDPAGIVWLAAGNGLAAYDVSDPLNPDLLNTSDEHGLMGPTNPYNDRLQLHGSRRPNAHRFRPDRNPDEATTFNGSVLLMSEEGTNQDCTDSFQTWLIPHLSESRHDANPSLAAGGGSITPLDHWSHASHTAAGVERPPATLGWCSVHWFDYHPAGFVALPGYYQGTHVLDVRDPRAIELLGHHWTLTNIAIQSYWVPARDANGRMNGHRTSLVYTADVGDAETSPFLGVVNRGTGGIDIFEVALPPH